MRLNIKKPLDTALGTLTKQQQYVLSSRYGLNGKKPQTLNEIADKYSLTRERIRQIEANAIKILKSNECAKSLSVAIKDLEKALGVCGGVAHEETICMTCEIATVAEKGYVRLLLNVGESFKESKKDEDLEKYWYNDEGVKKSAESVLGKIHKKFADDSLIVKESELKELFDKIAQQHNADLNYKNVVSLSRKIKGNKFNEWGLSENPRISLPNLTEYIDIVLTDADKPLHFNDIAEKVAKIRKRKCNSNSCHNDLVRNGRFILVGRGMYALKRDGYEQGSISEIIAKILKKQGPMKREDIINEVEKQRTVKTQSIIINLNNKNKFKRKEGLFYIV